MRKEWPLRRALPSRNACSTPFPTQPLWIRLGELTPTVYHAPEGVRATSCSPARVSGTPRASGAAPPPRRAFANIASPVSRTRMSFKLLPNFNLIANLLNSTMLLIVYFVKYVKKLLQPNRNTGKTPSGDSPSHRPQHPQSHLRLHRLEEFRNIALQTLLEAPFGGFTLPVDK